MAEPMTDERLAEIEARSGAATFDEVLSLLKEIRRLRSGGWRPASEAPKEDGEYLTYFLGAVNLMYYTHGSWYDDGCCWDDHVTHWMPLPPAPPTTEAGR